MKYSILIAMVVMILASCSAQHDVSQSAQTAFNTKFPAATDVQWEDGDDEFEAEFKFEGKSMSANFSKSGSWLETTNEVKKQELPEIVSMAVSAQYPGFEIDEVEMIETPDMKGYELEIKKDKQSKEVLFDLNGRFVKEKAEKDERSDKNDKDEDDD